MKRFRELTFLSDAFLDGLDGLGAGDAFEGDDQLVIPLRIVYFQNTAHPENMKKLERRLKMHKMAASKTEKGKEETLFVILLSFSSIIQKWCDFLLSLSHRYQHSEKLIKKERKLKESVDRTNDNNLGQRRAPPGIGLFWRQKY